jgi:hypothetical protein
MAPRINKWLDFLDRVAWTSLQSLGGTLAADSIFNAELGWKEKLGIPVLSAVFAAVKVVVAQNRGSDDLGAAVPGHVLETPPGT